VNIPAALSQLTTITRLHLCYTRGGPEAPALAALSSLQHLELVHAETGPVVEALRQLQGLTALVLQGMGLAGSLPAVADLPRLQRFAFGTNGPPPQLPPGVWQRSLRKLYAPWGTLAVGRTVGVLGQMPHLEYVCIAEVPRPAPPEGVGTCRVRSGRRDSYLCLLDMGGHAPAVAAAGL